MKTQVFNFLTAAIVVATSILQCADAQNACDSLDEGPYLATRPTLFFAVDEATHEDLQATETSNDLDLRYHSELRLHGVAGADFTIQSLTTGVFDPSLAMEAVHRDGVNYLKLVQPVDRDGPTASLDDDTSVVNFMLKCIPTNMQFEEQMYDATLLVNDVNDNTPTVEQLEPVTISENLPPGTIIAAVSAVDLDLNLDNPLKYTLADNSGKFSMDSETGVIQLAYPLDFEEMDESKSVELTALVKDGGPGELRTATAVLRVHVTDEDDQAPVFVYDGCESFGGICVWPRFFSARRSFHMDEVVPFTAYGGTTYTAIRAMDRDGDRGAEIVFKIVSTYPPGHEGQFRVETHQEPEEDEYQATVKAVYDVIVPSGFQILLLAEEQSEMKRSSTALLQFEGDENAQDSSSSDNLYDDDYTNTEIALIVSTAVLAALLLCLLLALVYLCCRRRASGSGKHQSDIQMGQHNSGYTL